MDENRLKELAARLKELFDDYDIDLEEFQLKLIVPKGYYDSIKDNFSTRNPLDVIVGTEEDDWTIHILYIRSIPISTQE